MLVKKILWMVTVMGLSFNLSACLTNLRPEDSRFYDSEGEKAEKRLNSIIAALESKDSDSIKQMFSQKALEEAIDIDAGIAYIMDFYKGKMISYGDKAGEGSGGVSHGKKKVVTRYWFTVTTDEEEYLFFFIDQLRNDEAPEEEGLYTLQIIKRIDREKEFDGTGDAGVYVPKKQDEAQE